MPSPYVAQLAKEKGIPIRTAEDRWDAAKKASESQGHKDDFDYITAVFQKMMGESVLDSKINKYILLKYKLENIIAKAKNKLSESTYT